VDCGGLLGGLTAYHIRLLTENPWNGGAGYTYEQVGQMTLDQIWHRLCDLDFLKGKVGKRVQKINTRVATGMIGSSDDGVIRGRSKDGSEIRGRVRGKSVARQLMEEAEKEREEQILREKRKRRKERRKK